MEARIKEMETQESPHVSGLDNIMLQMLHSQLALPAASPSVHGAAFMMLTVLRKALVVSDVVDSDALNSLVGPILDWRPSIVESLSKAAEKSSERAELVSAFFLAASMRRHWSLLTVELCKRLCRAVVTGQGDEARKAAVQGQLQESVASLLDLLASICQLLSGSSTEGVEMEILKSREHVMEYLLQSAQQLALDLLSIIHHSLSLHRDNAELMASLLLSTGLVSLCARAELGESLRDLAIALDLLSQVDLLPSTTTSPASSAAASPAKGSRHNPYQARLSSLLGSVAGLSARIQELKTEWIHAVRCRHGRGGARRTCWVREAGGFHHHSLTAFPDDVPHPTPARCSLAFLNDILLTCVRNVGGPEDAAIAADALAVAGRCCCVRPEALLAALLPQPPALLPLALRCLSKITTLPRGLGKSADCAICASDEEAEETPRLALVLRELLATSDDHKPLLRLLDRTLPVLRESSRHVILAEVVIRGIADECTHLLGSGTVRGGGGGGGGGDEHRLLLGLLALATHILKSSPPLHSTYAAIITVFHHSPPYLLQTSAKFQHLYPLADILFYCAETQGVFIAFLKQGCLVECAMPEFGQGEVLKSWEGTLSLFVFDKFRNASKLCQQDLGNLLSWQGDAASEYWSVVELVLELSGVLLGSSALFRTIFTGSNGPGVCCSLVSESVGLAWAGQAGSWGSRGAQRLSSLLWQLLGLPLSLSSAGAREELLSAARAALLPPPPRPALPPAVLHRLVAVLVDSALLCDHGPRRDGRPRRRNATDVDRARDNSMSESDESYETAKDEDSSADSGYDGDIDLDTLHNATSHIKNLTVCHGIKYPELLILAVQFLIHSLADLKELSEKDFVVKSVIQKLRLLLLEKRLSEHDIQQIRVLHFSKLLHQLQVTTVKSECSFQVQLELMELRVGILRHSPDADELKNIISLVETPDVPKRLVVEALSGLMVRGGEAGPRTWVEFPSSATATPRPASLQTSLSSASLPFHRPPRRQRADTQRRRDGSLPLRDAPQPTLKPATSNFFSSISSFFSKSMPVGGSQRKSPEKRRGHFLRSTSGTLGRGSTKKPRDILIFPNAAVVMGTEENPAGPQIEEGISVAGWMQLSRAEDGVGDLALEQGEIWWHVMSLGVKDLQFSVAVHATKNLALLMLSGRNGVVEERRAKALLPIGPWFHLGLSLQYCNHAVLYVQMTVDGLERRGGGWAGVDWMWDGSADSTAAAQVGFGFQPSPHLRTAPLALRVSTLNVFHGYLSSESMLVLKGLGSSCVSPAETRNRTLEIPGAALLVKGSEILASGVELGRVLEDTEGMVELCQKALLYCFNPAAAASYTLYHQLSPDLEAAIPALEQSTKQGLRPVSSLAPELRFPSFVGSAERVLRVASRRRLEELVEGLGGARLLLLVFARVVELDPDPATQAAGLVQLFRGLRRRPSWWRTFLSTLQGYPLLKRLVQSPKVVKGPQLLKAIFAVSMGGPSGEFLSVESETLEEALAYVSHSAIEDPNVLSHLLGESGAWVGAGRAVWESGLAALAAALDEGNAFAAFNVVQLNRTRFLRSLLVGLLEMWQEEGAATDTGSGLAESVVAIARALVGNPVNVGLVREIHDFLFLSHPAPSTYLNYRVPPHSPWIKPNEIGEKAVPLLDSGQQSPLVHKLREYLDVLGLIELRQILEINHHSVVVVKNEYEKKLLAKPRKQEPQAESEDPPAVLQAAESFHGLPDLVCDIANAGGGESSDWSMCEDGTSMLRGSVAESRNARNSARRSAQEGHPKARLPESAWMAGVRAGLVALEAAVVLTGPDGVVERLVPSVVKWEHLLVMLNHQRHAELRDGCMSVLCAILLRSPGPAKTRFLKSRGFELLGTQLAEFPSSAAILDSLFSLLCGERLHLKDGLDASHLAGVKVGPFESACLIPILAVLPHSLHDPILFWNLTSNIRKILESNSALARALLDQRMVEVLVSVLVGISKLPKGSETTLMLECWESLASRLLQSCVSLSDLIHHQACVELVSLLFAADAQLGPDVVVRGALCALLRCWLDAIRNLYTDEGLSASGAINVDPLGNDLFSPVGGVVFAVGGDVTRGGGRPRSVLCDSSMGSASSFLSRGVDSGASSLLSDSLLSLREKVASLSTTSGSGLGSSGASRESRNASQSELLERLKLCLQFCADLFLHLAPSASCEQEEDLFEFFLYFLLSTAKADAERGGERRGRSGAKSWQRLLWGARDRVRLHLAHLIAFVLFPGREKLAAVGGGEWRRGEEASEAEEDGWALRRRLMVARALAHELHYKALLKGLLDIDLDYHFALNIAAHELILLTNTGPHTKDAEKLIRFLRGLKMRSPLENLDHKRLGDLATDELLCLQTYQELRQTWFCKLQGSAHRIFVRAEAWQAPISESAMALTCDVVGQQNTPRKLFIQHAKTAFLESAQAEDAWKSVAAELCHPAAPLFAKDAWPASTALDPTEGPNRERRRLVPAHSAIDPVFVRAAARHPPAAAAPLSSLWAAEEGRRGSKRGGEDSDLVGRRLGMEEGIALSCAATLVQTGGEVPGELLLGDSRLFFVPEEDGAASLTWPHAQLRELYRRLHQLRDLALEIFTVQGDSYLITFQTQEKRNEFLQRLLMMDLPNLKPFAGNLLQSLSQAWREGYLTNFEYLMELNKLAGRTFSDLMQYPIFPFVLSDYSSLHLDLGSPSAYRDLAKPIAIQELRMEEHYKWVYRCLDLESRRDPGSSVLPNFGPYHYGSHYSNSGIVAHYLVRLAPFTATALKYQDGAFDIADRLFHSLELTWRLASAESTTDFKELTPEFFCLPDFLLNSQGLDLGTRQGGKVVHDVELPPWTPNADPRAFIAIHRQALESPYVTAHLHSWIDLIFGYKQTGPAAVAALNVFHPATYQGSVEMDPGADDVTRSALATMVRTYGQMPRQLFSSPHLPHFRIKNLPQARPPKSPYGSVSGVRWGSFLGSPANGGENPVVVLKQRPGSLGTKPAALALLPDATVLGLPPHSQLIHRPKLSRQSTTHHLPHLSAVRRGVSVGVGAASGAEVDLVGVVSWSFGDGIARARLISPAPPSPWTALIALHQDQVRSSNFTTDGARLFLGFATGAMKAFRLDLTSASVRSCRLEAQLVGHGAAVTAIAVSTPYRLILSGDEQGRLLLWDLATVKLIRELGQQTDAVSHAVISDTTADLVTVAHSGYGSRVVVETVNGLSAGAVESELRIMAVALSAQPEGTAINVLAASLQNGLIRLWNMWNLDLVREISHPSNYHAFVGLVFSDLGRKLYAVTEGGFVFCWEDANQRHSKPPRYAPVTNN